MAQVALWALAAGRLEEQEAARRPAGEGQAGVRKTQEHADVGNTHSPAQSVHREGEKGIKGSTEGPDSRSWNSVKSETQDRGSRTRCDGPLAQSSAHVTWLAGPILG